MYVVAVKFVVDPEHAERFLEAVLQQASSSLAIEDECHVFDVCTDPRDASRVFLFEKYSAESSFQAHLESAHFKSFDDLVAPWVVEKTVETWIEAGSTS